VTNYRLVGFRATTVGRERKLQSEMKLLWKYNRTQNRLSDNLTPRGAFRNIQPNAYLFSYYFVVRLSKFIEKRY